MSVKKRVTEGIDSFAIIHFSPAAGIRADHLVKLKYPECFQIKSWCASLLS
jgi:hypothetical protein